MLEEAVSIVPSIWASIVSWFTPAVLFVLLNLMIATIAVTSGVGHQKPQKRTKADPTHHARSPSSVLQRLKSINFYAYRSPEPISAAAAAAAAVNSPPEDAAHFAQIKPRRLELEENPEEEEENGDGSVTDFGEDEATTHLEEEQSMEEVYGMIQRLAPAPTVTRVKSDTRPTAGEIPVRLPQKMKKSASAKSAFAHFEAIDAVESRRPATVREERQKQPPPAVVAEHSGDPADHEVDAKADDFINKFRHQLQLQRLESIMRYKEMLKRGSEK